MSFSAEKIDIIYIYNDLKKIKNIGKYNYNSENILSSNSSSNLNIDARTNDTITNTIEINHYDFKGALIQLELTDYLNPERKSISNYIYDCGTLKEIREFNTKDSLILKTEYKYEFDEFKNWVKRESFQNGKLVYIQKRKIEYKL
jgi:hypothetical protein